MSALYIGDNQSSIQNVLALHGLEASRILEYNDVEFLIVEAALHFTSM